jgi:hypothetical protein
VRGEELGPAQGGFSGGGEEIKIKKRKGERAQAGPSCMADVAQGHVRARETTWSVVLLRCVLARRTEKRAESVWDSPAATEIDGEGPADGGGSRQPRHASGGVLPYYSGLLRPAFLRSTPRRSSAGGGL